MYVQLYTFIITPLKMENQNTKKIYGKRGRNCHGNRRQRREQPSIKGKREEMKDFI